MRHHIAERTDAAFKADPRFKLRALADLNREAAALYKVLGPPLRCRHHTPLQSNGRRRSLLPCVLLGAVSAAIPEHRTRAYGRASKHPSVDCI